MEEPKYIKMSARSTVDARALFGQALNTQNMANKDHPGKETSEAEEKKK